MHPRFVWVALAVLAGCAGRTHQYVPVRSDGGDATSPAAAAGPATPAAATAAPTTPGGIPSTTAAHEMQPGLYFVTVDGQRRTTRVEAVFKWHELAADACGGRERYEVLAFPAGVATWQKRQPVDPNHLEGYVRCYGSAPPARREPVPQPEPVILSGPGSEPDPEPGVMPQPEPGVTPQAEPGVTPQPEPTPPEPAPAPAPAPGSTTAPPPAR